jgi:hypothetical protein
VPEGDLGFGFVRHRHDQRDPAAAARLQRLAQRLSAAGSLTGKQRSGVGHGVIELLDRLP